MTTPRERILASIREGLLRAALPVEASGATDAPAVPPAAPPASALAGPFTAALTALSGTVHRAAGAAGVADAITEIARAHQAATFISWDEEHLGCPGLVGVLASRGIARVTYDVRGEPERRAADAGALAGIVLGLTGAHAALADSGGLVLVSGPGRGRLPSVLPPVHVAVVGERRLRPSLAALLREEPGLLGEGSNVVIVAGPSRTADIEMTLTHGVHGPKHVHVVLTA
jgi:L-lactate dehydrogenase complex protein LldG